MRADEASSLRDYVAVLSRRRWAIVVAVVLVPLAALVLSLRQDPVYQATAEVLSRPNQAANLTGAVDPTAGQSPERLLQTQADLARVPQVAASALRRAGVDDRTPAELLDSSAVSAKATSNLLVFSVDDSDPRLAVALATHYARAFTVYMRDLETSSLKRARLEIGKRLALLERRDQTDTPVYGTLVEREQQLRALEALQTSNTVVARPASEAVRIRPQPLRNVAIGAFLGLLLGLCAAFLWEALDTRVRSTSEIERRLGLPLLARIPEPPRWLQRMRQVVMLAAPTSIEAEAFRVLRTNLDFFNLEHGARAIMVTSAVAGEGKSTTVANLAVALSRAGHRVILLDLDMRRPTIDRFFSFQDAPGLTDVVAGRARLAGVGVDDGEGGRLEVLTTGPLPKDPGEFIGSVALGEVLEQLKERADIVLIDSPPLLAVGDAIALSAKVDAIVVLTRLNVVRRSMLDELRRVLGTCQAAKLGFVVTGAELEQEHKYGYGYGYGYGYAQKAKRT